VVDPRPRLSSWLGTQPRQATALVQ
jgi:hypothetical protein